MPGDDADGRFAEPLHPQERALGSVDASGHRAAGPVVPVHVLDVRSGDEDLGIRRGKHDDTNAVVCLELVDQGVDLRVEIGIERVRRRLVECRYGNTTGPLDIEERHGASLSSRRIRTPRSQYREAASVAPPA